MSTSTLTNLQRSFAYSLLPSQFVQWIDAVSAYLDGLTDSQGQLKYVSKTGSDTAGDGSFAKPFLTIQAALTSITDAASSKTYTVMVDPGTYTEVFLMKPWVFIEGVDENDVILSPVQANWITTGFVSGTQNAGLSHVSLASAFVCDFSLVSAANAAKMMLSDIFMLSGSSITIKGFSASNAYSLEDIFAPSAVVANITLTNMSNGSVDGIYNEFGDFTIQSTDAYLCVHRIGILSTLGAVKVIWTGANTNNSNIVAIMGSGSITYAGNFVVTGAGAQLTSNLALNQVTLADANATLAWGWIPNPAGAIIGIAAGINVYEIQPSVARTLTLGRASNDGTRVIIKNDGDQIVTLAVTGGALIVGPSYIVPRGRWEAYTAGNVWIANPQVQAGVTTLVTGVSPVITADISASSRITATLKDINGGTLGNVIVAKTADRVVGARGAGGVFKLTSVSLAGATVATDVGIYDWHVVG